MPTSSRTQLATRIEQLASPEAQGLATFIRSGDPGGPVPCWGAIIERFTRDFVTDAQRLEVWARLVDEGDRRPMLLFLHVSQDRPAVMARALVDAPRLPRALQRALVSFQGAADLVGEHLASLDAAARQLVQSGPVALAKERELAQTRIKELLAFRYFVPDGHDPAQEPSEPSPPAVVSP